MDLHSYRSEINKIDAELAQLLIKRFNFVKKIANIKLCGNIPIENTDRENFVIKSISKIIPENHRKKKYIISCFFNIIEHSKKYQLSILKNERGE
ncbi:MAG: chorismate mutase [Oscillospiraceae bacterium]|nr:chorismate mutase [Oscillospiraceae bacterium]